MIERAVTITRDLCEAYAIADSRELIHRLQSLESDAPSEILTQSAQVIRSILSSAHNELPRGPSATLNNLITYITAQSASEVDDDKSQRLIMRLWESAADLVVREHNEFGHEGSQDVKHLSHSPHESTQTRDQNSGLTDRLRERLNETSQIASRLQIQVDELTDERSALQREIERLGREVVRLKEELSLSQDEVETLSSILEEYEELESERAPLEDRCSDLYEAAALLEAALSSTPHSPPLDDVFTIMTLPSEEYAHRREVSYREQHCTLRYVRSIESDQELDSFKASWELEAQNMRELAEANTPSLARLMFSPPSHAPAYALWSRPQGLLLSDLAGQGKLCMLEVSGIGLSVLRALELRADHRSVNLMPRLDAMSYQRSRALVTLLEPAAVSKSVLSPPEWGSLEQLYLLTRSELEKGWVFGVCEVLKKLLLPAEVSAGLTDSTKSRALKVSIAKATRRAQRDYSTSDIESLHTALLSGLSFHPNQRLPMKQLREILSDQAQ